MIAVTKLNGHPVVLNAEMIKYLESTPDTMITLINGEKLLVKEPVQEVVRKAVEYIRSVRVFAA